MTRKTLHSGLHSILPSLHFGRQKATAEMVEIALVVVDQNPWIWRRSGHRLSVRRACNGTSKHKFASDRIKQKCAQSVRNSEEILMLALTALRSSSGRRRKHSLIEAVAERTICVSCISSSIDGRTRFFFKTVGKATSGAAACSVPVKLKVTLGTNAG